MYISLPLIFQIRDNCIIAYSDFSVLEKKGKNKDIERNKIVQSGTYTENAKKRLKKYLDIWTYTNTDYKTEYSFITLTISSRYKKNVQYNKYIKEFIEKLEYRYKNINWIWKLELQENGNPHYHLIVDKKTDWKVIRSIWNKIQKIHVDEYQIKHKEKYKNGYYFDKQLVNKNGEVIEEEIQKKRYEKGYKANWRNPNSTDVKIEENIENVKKYVSKYISKNETDKNTENININRWFGTKDTLKFIRFPTLPEALIKNEESKKIIESEIKKIEENGLLKCIIYEKIQLNSFEEIIKKTVEENRKILKYDAAENREKLINKDIQHYSKLFE